MIAWICTTRLCTEGSMRYWIRRTVGCAVLLALVLIMRPADSAEAQSVQYRRDQSWVPIPENAEDRWEMSAVTSDREGRRVYATRRSDPPILEIDGGNGGDHPRVRDGTPGLAAWHLPGPRGIHMGGRRDRRPSQNPRQSPVGVAHRERLEGWSWASSLEAYA